MSQLVHDFIQKWDVRAYAVSVDGTGNVYALYGNAWNNQGVKVFNSNGNEIGSWQSTRTLLIDLVVHNNLVYVLTSGGGSKPTNYVDIYDLEGTLTTTITFQSTTASGIAKKLAFDSSNNLYVLRGDGLIAKFGSNNSFIANINLGRVALSFAIVDDRFWTSSIVGTQTSLYKSTLAGVTEKTFLMASPVRVFMDIHKAPNGNLYISNGLNKAVIVVNSAGATIATFGQGGTTEQDFKNTSWDVAIFGDYVYVLDQNTKIMKYEALYPAPPNAPTNLRAVAVSSSRIDLSWEQIQ